MTWQIQGQYMETCNCAFVCPCIVSNLTARPTEGGCKAVMGMLIEKGEKDGVKLDGLAFAVVISSPGPMVDGDMTVGRSSFHAFLDNAGEGRTTARRPQVYRDIGINANRLPAARRPAATPASARPKPRGRLRLERVRHARRARPFGHARPAC